MKEAFIIIESRSNPFFFPNSKIKRSDDVKINIKKEHISILVLPVFALIMLIAEFYYAKDIYYQLFNGAVVVFLFQLGLRIGSLDEKVKGMGNRLDDLEKVEK